MTMEEQVRQAVARGWCHPANAHKEMDVDLADAIVKEVVEGLRAGYGNGGYDAS